ncbi:MAG: hypothetical protein ACFFD4_12570 [Candidatus Odinarchaeota archaeon]
MSPGKELFAAEKAILVNFIAEKRKPMSDEVLTVFRTLDDLLQRYPKQVKDFDLNRLREYMVKKAEKFYDYFRDKQSEPGIHIEKKKNNLYSFASITLFYKSTPFLYPLMLVRLINYHGFIRLLCQRLGKITKQELVLNDFLDEYTVLSRQCRPKLVSRDIDMVKKLSKFDFSVRYYYRKIMRLDADKRYKRLVYLGVLGIYHGINFPVLGLVPYLHLTSRNTGIPAFLNPHIELEYHPAKKGKDYQVFRLFLIPGKVEKEWVPLLRESGLVGKLDEWYIRYNWDNLRHTTEFTWKWDLEYSIDTQLANDHGKFDLIENQQGEMLTVNKNFIACLEVCTGPAWLIT